MSKHTPGPWYSLRLNGGQIAIDAKPGAHDHVTICVLGMNAEEDARLIAAAPELLDACKAVVAAHGLITGRAEAIQKAMDAIAKAEGDE